MAPKHKDEKLLTAAELELMAILWKIGAASVNEVLAALPAKKSLAYTTVSTILRILEQKGFVSARKEGRGHSYVPRLEKEEYEARSLRHMVDRVFAGAPIALARQLLQTSTLSSDELQELKRLIDQLEKKS